MYIPPSHKHHHSHQNSMAYKPAFRELKGVTPCPASIEYLLIQRSLLFNVLFPSPPAVSLVSLIFNDILCAFPKPLLFTQFSILARAQ